MRECACAEQVPFCYHCGAGMASLDVLPNWDTVLVEFKENLSEREWRALYECQWRGDEDEDEESQPLAIISE